MKKSVAITTIVALHAAVIGTLLVQAGCSSEPETNDAAALKPASAQTTEIAANANTDVSVPAEPVLPPEGSIARRSDPTRPIVEDTAPQQNLNDIAPDGQKPDLAKPAEPTLAPVAETAVYKVKKGDSISRIAKKHGISATEIMKLNGLDKSSVIKIGQEIKIPAQSEAPAVVAPKSDDIQAAPVSAEMEKYEVKKGDSLSRIAHKHGTSVFAIMAANNLKNHNIRVGQKLSLPANGAAVKASVFADKKSSTKRVGKESVTVSEGEIKYTVKNGDYLGSIAKKFGTSVSAISERNKISDPRKIRVGQVIVIKAAKNAGEGDAAKVSAPKAETPKTEAPKPVAAPEVPVVIGSGESSPTIAPAPVETPKVEENKIQVTSDQTMPVVEI